MENALKCIAAYHKKAIVIILFPILNLRYHIKILFYILQNQTT
jgi:hypothetical protein